MKGLRKATFFLGALLTVSGCGKTPALPEGVQETDLPASFENSLGMKLVRIPSGTFTMGEEGLEGFNPEGKSASVPLHEVELDCFYLANKEVTKGQFREYVRAKNIPWGKFPLLDPEVKLPPPHFPEGGPQYDGSKLSKAEYYFFLYPANDYPVIDISWKEAAEFCEWLSEKEGRRYRLPTEAEWEYSCRAGTRTIYWWGNEFDRKKARIGGDNLAPVGSYPPNPWGLYDMIGNVYEFASDYYDPYYYESSPRKNPKGPVIGFAGRVTRGGGASDHEGDPQLHAGARQGVKPDFRWPGRGSRIACDAASVGGREVIGSTLLGNARTHYHLIQFEGQHLNPVWDAIADYVRTGNTPAQVPP